MSINKTNFKKQLWVFNFNLIANCMRFINAMKASFKNRFEWKFRRFCHLFGACDAHNHIRTLHRFNLRLKWNCIERYFSFAQVPPELSEFFLIFLLFFLSYEVSYLPLINFASKVYSTVAALLILRLYLFPKFIHRSSATRWRDWSCSTCAPVNRIENTEKLRYYFHFCN